MGAGKNKTFTLGEIAKLTESTLVGDPQYKILGYADLESASEHEISFLSSPRYTKTRYASLVKHSQAGAIFVTTDSSISEKRNYLIHADPSKAFQIIVEAFLGENIKYTYFTSIHQAAVIHETATIGEHVTIGPNAVIDAYVVIGDHSTIGPVSFIGPHTKIGAHSVIHPNVTIREGCEIGNHVVIQPGTVVGACGFGFSTSEKGVHTRIKQIGKVVIEDHVEIASNCSIDRARFTETRIGQGTKIDSNCVIGHNVTIGKHCIICGQTGIAGSTKIGNHVVIAGQCGIDGHLKIDNGVMVSAKSGVTKSLPKGKYGGHPARPIDQFNRTNVLLHQLETHIHDLKELKAGAKQDSMPPLQG